MTATRTWNPTPWLLLLALAVLAAVARLAVAWSDELPAVVAVTATLAVPVVAVYGVVVALLVRTADRWRVLRAGPVAAAFVWGALPAVAVAGAANGDLTVVVQGVLGVDTAAAWTPPLVAPVVEETAKALGVVVAVLVAGRALVGPLEGMLLGSVAGLGFQLVENVVYAFRGALYHPSSDVAGVLSALAGRLPSGLFGHWMFSGLAGLAVGVVVSGTAATRPGARRVAVLAGGGAIVGHWLFNSVASLLTPLAGEFASSGNAGLIALALIILVLSFTAEPVLMTIAFLFALRWAGRVQAGIALADLAGEPPAVVSDEERAALATGGTARRTRRELARVAGKAAGTELRRRQRAQRALASQLAHARCAHRDPATDPSVARARERCLPRGAPAPAGA